MNTVAFPDLDPPSPPSPSAPAVHPWSTAIDITAGAIGGAAGKFSEYPLDVVKTRQQSASMRGGQFANLNSLQVILKILRNEGVFGFYRGVFAPMLACAIECSIAFSVFYFCARYLAETKKDEHSYLVVGVAGAAGGVANGLFLTPSEYLKCNIQNDPAKYPTLRAALRLTLQEGGPRALMRGCSGTLGRELPGSAGFFLCLEAASRNFFGHHLDPETGDVSESAPWYVPAVCGGCAGFGLFFFGYPADTVKTLLSVSEENRARGFFGTARHVYVSKGMRGFFPGFGITMLRAFPSNALIVLVYSNIRAYFERRL